MTLPAKPPLSEATIVRHQGALAGPINPGEVFAWNPDIPCAREYAIVAKVENGKVWTWDMQYKKWFWNDESTFREACYRTLFHLFPIKPIPQG